MARMLLLTAALAASQAAQPTFRTTTELVALNVTVTDAGGSVVRDLPREVFAITEDGQPRPIAQFAVASVPLSLVVAVDASLSMAGPRIEYARQAVLRLLDRLDAADEFVVFGFNDRVFNITDGTKDRDQVARALARVRPHGATALYDAVRAGVQLLDRATHRRRALVVISDGSDAVSSPQGMDAGGLRDAREVSALGTVRRTESLVYAIAAGSRTGGSLDVPALDRLTKPTGGYTLVVASDDAVVTAAERVGNELRLQYVLGFPPAHSGDGKFHRVEVTIRNCENCRVRARAGFLAATASR